MSTNPTTITTQPGTPFVDVEREFDATPAQVFRALTDPDLVSRWLHPSGLTMRVDRYDTRPGGSYAYTHVAEDGTEYAFHGVFHDVRPDELIVQTFEFAGAPGDVSLDTLRLHDLGDRRTRLHTRSVHGSVQARDAMVAAGMAEGVTDALDQLADLLTPTGIVVADISMSLDGYVTGPGADLSHGLGVDGDVLHHWTATARTDQDTEILARTMHRAGAVIMGRTTFDFIDGPNGWTEETTYGAHPDDAPPIFVVTTTAPDHVRLGQRFHFVTDGLPSAAAQAKAAAGPKDVVIMGGGAVVNAFLQAGLVDELTVHLAPVVLGAGTRLFPAEPQSRVHLTQLASERTPAAEHITYRVLP